MPFAASVSVSTLEGHICFPCRPSSTYLAVTIWGEREPQSFANGTSTTGPLHPRRDLHRLHARWARRRDEPRFAVTIVSHRGGVGSGGALTVAGTRLRGVRLGVWERATGGAFDTDRNCVWTFCRDEPHFAVTIVSHSNCGRASPGTPTRPTHAHDLTRRPAPNPKASVGSPARGPGKQQNSETAGLPYAWTERSAGRPAPLANSDRQLNANRRR